MHLLSPSGALSEAPAAERRTLLIVDDEDGPRQSLRIVFKDDYDVLLADSGPRALELLGQHHVDAAVLDIRMSGMSGTELLARLKELDPDLEVVMLTAYETIDTMRQSLRRGACDYLTKPFDVSTMRSAVARAMSRRQLADEVRANENELNRLREEIERERMQAELARQKGEIYASVIHDLNNPLTVIAGVIELINREIAGLNASAPDGLSAVQQHLAQISRQVTSCSQISRRYLGFLRQRNSGDVRVPVNLVLGDVLGLMKNHRASLGHTLRAKPLEADAEVAINGTDFIQILLNLVTNALQAASSPVTVEISARLVDNPVAALPAPGPHDFVLTENTARPASPGVCIAVSDNGPGIPAELVSRVFEPYFTTKPAGQGSGLGLAIVWRLVKASGGAIHLHSEPGRGTTFAIHLPRAAAKAA